MVEFRRDRPKTDLQSMRESLRRHPWWAFLIDFAFIAAGIWTLLDGEDSRAGIPGVVFGPLLITIGIWLLFSDVRGRLRNRGAV